MSREMLMPPKKVSKPSQDAVICEIDIAAPRERVFKAIVDPADVRRRAPELDVYEMDARVGGKWRLELRPGQSYNGVSIIRHDGEVLEIDPPRLLVYSWFANFHKNPKMRTTVRWELTETKYGTHVRLTHSGLAADPAAAKGYAGGWPGVLEVLRNYIEHRKGIHA